MSEDSVSIMNVEQYMFTNKFLSGKDFNLGTSKSVLLHL